MNKQNVEVENRERGVGGGGIRSRQTNREEGKYILSV